MSSDAPPEAQYTVRAVAARIGVPTATLRSWSRRYGIGPYGHLPGRHRLYNVSDVAVVEKMAALVRRGVRPASAARAVLGSVGADEIRPPESTALAAAADRLDASGMLALVGSSLRNHGVVATWEQVCRPAFGRIDARQQGGEECIDVEHLLSWSVLTSMHRVEGMAVGDPTALLLCCVDGDLHTLPLEVLRAALAERGRLAQMLGPVPAAALVSAIERRAQQSTVVLWAQIPGRHETAVRAARNAGAEVFVCGPGWRGARLPRDVRRLTALSEAVGVLASTRPPARAAGS